MNYSIYVNYLSNSFFLNKFSYFSVHKFYINRDFVILKWFSFRVVSLFYANNLSLTVCHELPTMTIVLIIFAYCYSLMLLVTWITWYFFFLSAWLKYSWGREGLEKVSVIKYMCAGVHEPINILRNILRNKEYHKRVAVKSKQRVYILIKLNLWLNLLHP